MFNETEGYIVQSFISSYFTYSPSSFENIFLFEAVSALPDDEVLPEVYLLLEVYPLCDVEGFPKIKDDTPLTIDSRTITPNIIMANIRKSKNVILYKLLVTNPDKYNTLVINKTMKQPVSSMVSIYLTRVYYLKQ
ncbi:hypothetical protein JCM30204_16730 [Dysgonomonas termitidis]